MSNSLSVRATRRGHTINHEVVVKGSRTDLAAPHLVILIHGYQNSIEKARHSYQLFQDALRSALPSSSETRLGPMWEFHWPGDHPLGAISVVTYPVRVPEAREAGRLLAGFLAGLDPRQTIRIVAHSLGCRVALEAVRTIRQQNHYTGARLEALFLLAAAVPAPFCESGDLFPSAATGSTEHVFHSRRDMVLRFGFPFGQYMYGEEGPAVGRDGLPNMRWKTTMDTRLPHKAYWKSSGVARRIGELLGLFLSREIDARTLPADDLVADARELDELDIAHRALPVRRLD